MLRSCRAWRLNATLCLLVTPHGLRERSRHPRGQLVVVLVRRQPPLPYYRHFVGLALHSYATQTNLYRRTLSTSLRYRPIHAEFDRLTRHSTRTLPISLFESRLFLACLFISLSFVMAAQVNFGVSRQWKSSNHAHFSTRFASGSLTVRSLTMRPICLSTLDWLRRYRAASHATLFGGRDSRCASSDAISSGDQPFLHTVSRSPKRALIGRFFMADLYTNG